MPDIKYEITKKLAILSDRGKGWRKEVNLVSWNDGKPKLDIREWREDHGSMRKGITLTKTEFNLLFDALKRVNPNSLADYVENYDSKSGETKEENAFVPPVSEMTEFEDFASDDLAMPELREEAS